MFELSIQFQFQHTMIWDIHILISNTIFRKDSVGIGMQGMCFITLYMDSQLRVHCIVGYKLTFTYNLSYAMHTTERFTYCILYAEIAWWRPSIKKLTLIELSTQMKFFLFKISFQMIIDYKSQRLKTIYSEKWNNDFCTCQLNERITNDL